VTTVRLYSHHLAASEGVVPWLVDQQVTLILATGNRLWVVGVDHQGRLEVTERPFEGAGPLSWSGDRLLVTGLWRLWSLVEAPAHRTDGYERLLLPQTAHTVGSVGMTDVAVTDAGPVLVSSMFNCLAVPDPVRSIRPVWTPPWTTALVAENRCYLTGVAVDNGRAAYLTSASTSDVSEGWKDEVLGGGVLVATDGRIVAGDLTLPRNPRVGPGGEVVLLDSGTGRLLRVDPATGIVEELFRVPLLLAGLDLCGPYAVLGAGAPTDPPVPGLPVAEVPVADHADLPRQGALIVDRASGRLVGSLAFQGLVGPVEGVAVIPGGTRASLASPRGLTAQTQVSLDAEEELFRPGPSES
jgi:uncharacterized protein (TIGR03032 family)